MSLHREKVFSHEILLFITVIGLSKSSQNVLKQQASLFPIWIVFAIPKVKTALRLTSYLSCESFLKAQAWGHLFNL